MRPVLIAALAVTGALAAACGSSSSSIAVSGSSPAARSSSTGNALGGVTAATGQAVETSYLTMRLRGRWSASTPTEQDTLRLLDAAAPGANIQVKSTSGVSADQLGTVVIAIEQQIVKGLPDAMFTEADGDVAGAPAKAIIYTATSSGVAVKGMEIFTAHGSGDYFFVLSSSVADFPAELKQFQAIVTSVRWR